MNKGEGGQGRMTLQFKKNKHNIRKWNHSYQKPIKKKLVFLELFKKKKKDGLEFKEGPRIVDLQVHFKNEGEQSNKLLLLHDFFLTMTKLK